MNDRYPIHTSQTAPEGSRAAVETTEKQLHFVPNLTGTMADSPQLLAGFNELKRLSQSLSLPALDREVISLVMAVEVGCAHCLAFHTMTLQRMRAPESLIPALKKNGPLDARLSALRDFTRAMIQKRGDVPDDVQERFFAAGFTSTQALEIVLMVGMLTLTTHASRVARVPLDEVFVALAS